MRWLIGVVLTLVALAALLVASAPLWLGAALAHFGPKYGLTFVHYQRKGYERFALDGVRYHRPGVDITADHVEAATPLVWWWQHAHGGAGAIAVGKWTVAIAPRPSTPPKPHTGPGGWVPTQRTIAQVVQRIDAWIGQARLGPGTVTWPQGSATVDDATWTGRTLSVHGLGYRGHRGDVSIAVPAAGEDVSATIALRGAPARLELHAEGAKVRGALELWENSAPIELTFADRGWVPTDAVILARDWHIPGDALRLDRWYRAVQGRAEIDWHSGRFSIDASAQGVTLPAEHAAPPVTALIRAHGDTASATIQMFQVALPGFDAHLDFPFTVQRNGTIEGDRRPTFLVTANLSELPWAHATGTVQGRAELVSAPAQPPDVAFELAANGIAASGVAIARATAKGHVDRVRVDVTEGALVGAAGDTLTWHGAYDFKTKQVQGAEIAGAVRRETLARWLPRQPTFERVRINAQASGPIAAVQHQGEVQLADVGLPSLKPLTLDVTWRGQGAAADEVVANVAIAATTLAVRGTVNRTGATLSDLELRQHRDLRLKLEKPANISWKPSLQVHDLRLAGPDASLVVDAAWGPQGQLQLAAKSIPTAWAADVLMKPPPQLDVQSLAVTGSWNQGPAEYSIGLAASASLGKLEPLEINLSAHGDAHALQISALRVSENATAVISAQGTLPITVTPGGSGLARLDPSGDVSLDASTIADTAFWSELSEATGVALQDPRVELHAHGSWERPEGELLLRTSGMRFDAKRFGRTLPDVDAVDVHLVADRAGVQLDRFLISVAGQPIRASGRLPFPEQGWRGLGKQPLEALRAGADVRLQVDQAKIAAFEKFLPKLIAPTGTVTLDATYRNGAFGGSLELQHAATTPLGPLGVLRDVAADVALTGRKLVIRSVQAEAGGQPVKLDGSIELPERGGPQFHLSLAAKNVPFVREPGLLVRGDLDLKLQPTADGSSSELSGTVRLRDSLFLRDLQSLMPQGGGGGTGKAPPYFAVNAAPMRDWRVSVRVTGNRFMRFETPVFTGLASMDFQLLGTLGVPRAIGAATLDQGQVIMPFATFDVQHGAVRLTEADPEQPRLDIVATTRKLGYDLRMEVKGTAANPDLQFSSSPPLQSDQILLLVTAGVAPNNEITTSNTQRAVQIGAYLGKGLLGAGGGQERLKIESGADVSEQGKPTYSISYRLSNHWTALGEYNRFDEYAADLKYRLWPHHAKDDTPEDTKRSKVQDAATIDVRGAGWLTGHKLEKSLDRLLGAPSATLPTNSIEDAAVILLSTVREDGYQDATLDIKVTTPDGAKHTFPFDPTFAQPLPRDLQAKHVEFDLHRGTRWEITGATVEGLTAMPEDKAVGLFYSNQALFNASANAYAPSRLTRGASALQGQLERAGYVDAKVTARVASEQGGKVKVAVTVDQGPKYTVTGVSLPAQPSPGVALPETKKWIGQPLAPTLRQDIRNEVRQAYFRGGYPDAEVSIEAKNARSDALTVASTIEVRVDPRQQVRIGAIRFKGNEHTKTSVLSRQVGVSPGDTLDVLALERARYRIARLGVFDDVQLNYEPATGPERDAVFQVEEAPRFQTSLLAGYGAYEQLRVGVETRQQDLFGHAHQSRLKVVQSMKSTSFDFTYTIPELFGEDIDGTAEVYALRRREIAFLRKEFGTSFTLQRPLPNTGGAASLRYTFGALANSRNALITRFTDRSQYNVGSVTLTLTGDRRDHPLDPRRGYNWLTRLEVANPAFGGVSTYQRFEISGGYHTPWGNGRWLHVGLSHGVVMTIDGTDATLPLNRRFFPGGADSIRGYQNGEAAPRDAEGRFIGAKSFTLLNLELEQAITPSISAVVFGDALGTAAYLRDYPWETRLYTIGLGLRYRTVVGPIRVEYGRNVNPRPADSSGTWQITIGYPF